jgi:Fur family transcriptional regulator, ferric uptake regulator
VAHGWRTRYELSEIFTTHHHHATCTSCGALVAIRSDELEALVARLAAEHGFTAQQHQFEIQGLCPACRAAG